MVKPEFPPLTLKSPSQFEKVEGAQDVGIDKLGRSSYRAVDMRFGRQMYDGSDVMFSETFLKRRKVTDIYPIESVVRGMLNGLEIAEIPRVGETIDIDKSVLRISRDHQQQQVRADKPGATGDGNSL